MTATHIISKGSFAGLLFGGLVGVAVALMATPWSGKKTRQKIGGLAEDVKEKAESYASRAKGSVTSAIEKGRDIVEQKKALFVKAIDAGKKASTKGSHALVKARHTPLKGRKDGQANTHARHTRKVAAASRA